MKLRRASAARASQDFDLAADLARAVRTAAEALRDQRLELAACLELGQAITTCPIGEGYVPLAEVDLDAAEEAFHHALTIAREIGARSDEADALRELAVIEVGRVKQVAIAIAQETNSRLAVLERGPELFAKAKELAEQASASTRNSATGEARCRL
ncbi:MAG: hypothetical protein EHM57_08675 [Actinobacteria bacterium]|nr:MAG: hypothetical protein EHM57_08675 [Actinomycetota bacterium]